MKTFEIEIWIEGFEQTLVYRTDEKCFKDAYNAAIKTVKAHKERGRACKIIKIQEII